MSSSKPIEKTDGDQGIICLGCGIFRMEIEALARRGEFEPRMIALESMLHMKPALLEEKMETILAAEPAGKFLILYGDCHPHMHEMQNRKGSVRVAGLNCCEIFLGKEFYRNLQKEQAFIFLPEWTLRWREVFHRELGFENQQAAQGFMKDFHRRLVYVDTGVVPEPHKTLQEISVFFDMAVETVRISLDHLQSGINTALVKLKEDAAHDK
jgi:hypothetical protein